MKGIKSRSESLFNSPYHKVGINWFNEKYYKHLPEGKIRSHQLFGSAFYFYSPQEFLHGLEEIFIEELYKQNLAEKPYIIDCGANMGLSIVYMKRLCPGAEIVAFEPDDMNFDLLAKNMDSFGFQQITLRKEAIWKENTTLQFSNEGSMSSKIATEYTGKTRAVKATRLKDLLVRPIDFLKMDIEGAEFVVVMDAAEELHRVRNLFIEYHGSFAQQKELDTMLGLLTAKGFTYYIKEAAPIYVHPFERQKNPIIPFDVQLNIFCFKD